MRAILFACLTLLLTFPSGQVLAQSENSIPQYMYACNQGSASVSVIDTETFDVVDTIDLQELGFSANAKPHHIAVEEDGSYWYVSLIGENRVLKFSRDNDLVGWTEIEVPGLLALDPTNDILYAGRSMSAVNPPQSFGIIHRSDMSLQEEKDVFFGRPHALTTIPGENRVYVGSLSSNQFLSVQTMDDELELTNLEGTNHVLVNFAVSPDKQTLVGTGQVTGKLLVFDISDQAMPELTKSIDVNAQPWHPVFSPDGKYVYFANKGANSVTVVDMEKMEVSHVIEGNGLAQPHGAALSADGSFLFVTNNNSQGTYASTGNMEHPGTVVVIDTATGEIVKVIEVGMGTSGIGTNAY